MGIEVLTHFHSDISMIIGVLAMRCSWEEKTWRGEMQGELFSVETTLINATSY